MGNGVIRDTEKLYLSKSEPLSANFYSAFQEVQFFDMGSIQMIWSGADTTDGVFIPQGSNDKENWADIVSSADASNICAAEGSILYDFPDLTYRWWRIKFEANTTTTGTVSILAFVKRRR